VGGATNSRAKGPKTCLNQEGRGRGISHKGMRLKNLVQQERKCRKTRGGRGSNKGENPGQKRANRKARKKKNPNMPPRRERKKEHDQKTPKRKKKKGSI